MTGFNELIPPDLVNVFDERELELLIGGIADIDVDDWKKHTDYRGYTEQDEVIKNFWTVRSIPSVLRVCRMLTIQLATVHPQLGRRAKITPAAVCYRHVAHPCQRFQGPAGQRRAAEIHHREIRLRQGAAKITHMVRTTALSASSLKLIFPFCSFNRLDLPEYKTFEALSAKLTIAVEETVGFGQE